MDRERLFAARGRAIEAVLALHDQDELDFCKSCPNQPWPCATVRAITLELGPIRG